MSETVKNAAIGIKRMGIILWCVAAIVFIVFLSLHYDAKGKEVHIGVILTSMTLIAALGGVDKWKQVTDAR